MERGALVRVRRQWNDYRVALYRIEDVTGAHWDQVSGGVQAKAPRYFIHAYGRCNGMVEGELPLARWAMSTHDSSIYCQEGQHP